MIEPVDPFEGSELDGVEGTPRSPAMNELYYRFCSPAFRESY
jgi:hypothetical protein